MFSLCSIPYYEYSIIYYFGIINIHSDWIFINYMSISLSTGFNPQQNINLYRLFIKVYDSQNYVHKSGKFAIHKINPHKFNWFCIRLDIFFQLFSWHKYIDYNMVIFISHPIYKPEVTVFQPESRQAWSRADIQRPRANMECNLKHVLY